MIDVEERVTIARPVAKVFAFVANTTNDPQWHTDVLEAVKTSKGPVAAGTTYAIKFKPMMGKSDATMTVAEHVPNQRLVADVVFGPMRPHVSYTFSEQANATIVTRRIQVQPRGMMLLMSFMMRRMIRKRTQQFLANLKATLEK